MGWRGGSVVKHPWVQSPVSTTKTKSTNTIITVAMETWSSFRNINKTVLQQEWTRKVQHLEKVLSIKMIPFNMFLYCTHYKASLLSPQQERRPTLQMLSSKSSIRLKAHSVRGTRVSKRRKPVPVSRTLQSCKSGRLTYPQPPHVP